MSLSERLTAIDDWLLDRVFQPVADRLGERLSAFDLGLCLQLGAVVFDLAADAALFAAGLLGVGDGIYDGLSCAGGVWFYALIARQRPLVGQVRPNPLRVLYRSLRLLALASRPGACSAAPRPTPQTPCPTGSARSLPWRSSPACISSPASLGFQVGAAQWPAASGAQQTGWPDVQQSSSPTRTRPAGTRTYGRLRREVYAERGRAETLDARLCGSGKPRPRG